MAGVTVRTFSGDNFNAGKGSILEAALKAGIDFPCSCHAGECGECKSLLLEGQIDDGAGSGLSQAERKLGYFLACRARARSDCLIQVDALSQRASADFIAASHFAGTIIKHQHVGADVSIVQIQTETDFVFKPGQFAQLRFANGTIGPRAYSMAQSSIKNVVEFHIRRLPDGQTGRFLSKTELSDLAVSLEGPFGNAYFRTGHTGPIIAVAGGTGLAPILAIMHAALIENTNREIHLYVGARDQEAFYGEDIITDLMTRSSSITIHRALAEGSFSNVRQGHPHQVIEADFKDLERFTVYAAGPPVMVDTLQSSVLARGGLLQNFHADRFVIQNTTTTVAPKAEKKSVLGYFMSAFSSKKQKNDVTLTQSLSPQKETINV